MAYAHLTDISQFEWKDYMVIPVQWSYMRLCMLVHGCYWHLEYQIPVISSISWEHSMLHIRLGFYDLELLYLPNTQCHVPCGRACGTRDIFKAKCKYIHHALYFRTNIINQTSFCIPRRYMTQNDILCYNCL